MGRGTLKCWVTYLAKATMRMVLITLICQPGWPCPKFLCSVEGDEFPVVHTETMLGKRVWVIPGPGKGKHICGIAFTQGPRCTLWIMLEDGKVLGVPQGDLILCENSQ